jgi:hypothetical protein
MSKRVAHRGALPDIAFGLIEPSLLRRRIGLKAVGIRVETRFERPSPHMGPSWCMVAGCPMVRSRTVLEWSSNSGRSAENAGGCKHHCGLCHHAHVLRPAAVMGRWCAAVVRRSGAPQSCKGHVAAVRRGQSGKTERRYLIISNNRAAFSRSGWRPGLEKAGSRDYIRNAYQGGAGAMDPVRVTPHPPGSVHVALPARGEGAS